MNLQDLRDELTARATDSDDHITDLRPGVRRKIRRTKQRRIATAVGTVAAIAALAVAVVPSVIDTSQPDPADNIPADITKHGVTLDGMQGPDRLETGTIGEPGSNQLSIDWIPTTHDVALYTFCQSARSEVRYRLEINDQNAGSGVCSTSVDTPEGTMLQSDDSLWLNTPSGQPATFTIELVDNQGKPVEDQAAQLALGIYRSSGLRKSGPPSRIPPAAPGDYEKDSVRYRAKVGGESMLAAQVADRGQRQVNLTFTAPAGPVVLHIFCTADKFGSGSYYATRITLNGVTRIGGCFSQTTDAVAGPSSTVTDVAKPGEQVSATATLVDQNGKPVSVPQARIGLGIYEKGTQRQVADGIAVDELTEYAGYTYRLADVRTADAVTGKTLELATPEGKPFLIAFGSSDLGSTTATVELSGLSTQTSNGSGAGIGTVGEAARGPGTASVAISAGKATKGKLILAVYLPV